MKARATLQDIALKAGVSLSTASQALNHRGAISAETRARVLEAAERLGYRRRATPPTGVRPLRSVAMLVKRDPRDDAANSPFYYFVIKGIEAASRQLGLELHFATVDVDDHSRVTAYPQVLEHAGVDGFVLVGAVITDGPDFVARLGSRPFVLIDGYLAGHGCDRVGIDNQAGARIATEYLIARGHRHIGFVGGDANAHPGLQERRAGYLEALREHGLTPYLADSLVMTPSSAEPAARRLLTDTPQLTAIFAASDYVAMGVMRAAEALGRRAPEDLSLVGFDNLHLSEHLSPPLTTVGVDKHYLGVLGLRYLYESAVTLERPNVTLLVAPTLVERASVLAPRAVEEGGANKPLR
jgi:LacI family transcriptional regulator